MNKNEKIEKVKEYMAHCNGTNEYHQYNQFYASALITDGVMLVCEEFEAFWMIDLILFYQTIKFKQKNLENGNSLQYWTLEVKDDVGLAYMEFAYGNKREIEQKIPFTDFPVNTFQWTYNAYDEVICLPCED